MGTLRDTFNEYVSDVDTDTDTSSDTDTEDIGWNTITVNAPDRTSVVVRFDHDPGLTTTYDVETYAIDLDDQPLEILEVKYDPTEHTATLTTGEQTLGVSYHLQILDEGEIVQGIEATFLSADTATFWATDFSDSTFGQYQVTADRVAVGDRCVAYVEKGSGSCSEPVMKTAEILLVFCI
jgi:hypothetical protein